MNPLGMPSAWVHVRFGMIDQPQTNLEETDMKHRIKLLIGGTALVAAATLGTGVAIAGSGGDDDATERPIAGEARTRAEAAALASTGGGRVTATEEGDEESVYEVEVTRDDGSQVDVQLDRDFSVVGTKADRDTAEDGG